MPHTLTTLTNPSRVRIHPGPSASIPSSSRFTVRGRTPVCDKYKRMRFTLRHRTGGGSEGVEVILQALAKYDTRGARGTVTKAEFIQALKNLNVTLTEDQLRMAAEAGGVHTCPTASSSLNNYLFFPFSSLAPAEATAPDSVPKGAQVEVSTR